MKEQLKSSLVRQLATANVTISEDDLAMIHRARSVLKNMEAFIQKLNN